jgi:nitrite reductase/ring-hydroxylating ferredoxin subunit
MKVALCRVDEIPEDGTKRIDFFGRDALVVKIDGRPRVVLNVCMHLGGPMKLEADRWVCEWHGAEFDSRTGACLKGPAARSSRLIILPTRIDGETLFYEFGE